MSVRFRLSVSRLFDRVSVSVDLVSVCDRVEIEVDFVIPTVRRQFAHTSLYRELRPERGRGKLTKPPLGQVMSAQHK